MDTRYNQLPGTNTRSFLDSRIHIQYIIQLVRAELHRLLDRGFWTLLPSAKIVSVIHSAYFGDVGGTGPHAEGAKMSEVSSLYQVLTSRS